MLFRSVSSSARLRCSSCVYGADISIAGASPGSSSLLFTSLCRQLTTAPAVIFGEERPPCIVSRLTSRDCASIKSALRALIAGFLGSAPADDEQGEEGDEEEQVI